MVHANLKRKKCRFSRSPASDADIETESWTTTQILARDRHLRTSRAHTFSPMHNMMLQSVRGTLFTPRPAPKTVVPTAGKTTTSSFATDRTNLVEFLREDLCHLFDDQGIDTTYYDSRVTFRDPITSYDTVQGYVANINFLRRVFRPKFTLHDIQQTGDDEITFRWTMDMLLAGIHRDLVFTGTSKLGVNPNTGKFCSHLDTWDAIQNQEYFSLEAFLHMLGQLFVERPEALSGEVLLKRKEFEVLRRADGRVVAVFGSGRGVENRDKIMEDQTRSAERRVLERDGLQWSGRVDSLGGLELDDFELPPIL